MGIFFSPFPALNAKTC